MLRRSERLGLRRVRIGQRHRAMTVPCGNEARRHGLVEQHRGRECPAPIDHDVVSAAAIEDVLTTTADQNIVACPTQQRVVTGATDQDVITVAPGSDELDAAVQA